MSPRSPRSPNRGRVRAAQEYGVPHCLPLLSVAARHVRGREERQRAVRIRDWRSQDSVGTLFPGFVSSSELMRADTSADHTSFGAALRAFLDVQPMDALRVDGLAGLLELHVDHAGPDHRSRCARTRRAGAVTTFGRGLRG